MKHPAWSRVRALFQLLFWLAFISLLIATREPVKDPDMYNFLPRLSAHLAVTHSLTARHIIDSFIPALLILGATVFIGRFFCGWVCPMGSTIDVTDKLFRRDKRNQYRRKDRKIPIQQYKYLVLVVSIITGMGGLLVGGLIDPLSIAYRTYSTALYPYFDSLVKLVFNGLYYVPGVNVVSEPVFSVLKETVLDFNVIMFYNHVSVLGVFMAVILVSRFARRFWCQSLCPLGAFYALTSKLSVFRRVVDTDKCTNCLACVRDCRTNAITDDGTGTRETECIKCFQCLDSCKYDAIRFSLVKPDPLGRKGKPEEDHNGTVPAYTGVPGVDRRGFLYSLLASAMLLPVFKLNPGYRANHASIIRPPGAKPEEEFLRYCVRCGECMKVCPTNALHPTFLESGVDGMYTPRLIPRLGYCEMNCVLCSNICPTEALTPLDVADKETTIIGTAFIRHELCIPWSEYRDCLVCEEVCPTETKAIKLDEKEVKNERGQKVRVKFPFVIEDLCIGCGICENKCPVEGSSAIPVRAPKITSGGFL